MTPLENFRKQKNDFFGQQDSPLTVGDRNTFSGLKYFPENPSLKLELQLEENVVHDVVVLKTSTGSNREYARAGRITFIVEGQTVGLTVFRDPHGYFLPFRDGSSGNESYAAGRYLEPEDLGNGQLLVDFNYAYNPYCAYSSQYSCPLPPIENWLQIPIKAGEKKFHED